MVRTPAGTELDVTDPTLAAELGPGVRALKLDRGTFDAIPLSLITVQTVASLGALIGAELDVLRFRPNLLVEAVGDTPFPEEAWVGRTLGVRGLRIRVDRRDRRCVLVNVDPGTARRDPAILRAIARDRQMCLGVYGATVQPGRIAVGDPVVVAA